MKLKHLIFLGIFAVLTLPVIRAEDIVVQPTGEYADINVKLMTDTLKSLKDSTGPTRDDLVKKIIASPGNYPPPVLYVISSILFEEGKEDDAMFWFYAGQLRGHIDANICSDATAREGISVLNDQFGPRINQYALKDIPKLKQIVDKVMQWEASTPCNYDRRWINLHGMGAFGVNKNAPLSAPKEQWESIRKKTCDDYRSGFYAALKQLEAKKQ